MLERCEVLYEELEGWGSSSVGKSRWEELPEGARGYVEFIEGRVGVRVKYIGTGVEREAMIVR